MYKRKINFQNRPKKQAPGQGDMYGTGIAGTFPSLPCVSGATVYIVFSHFTNQGSPPQSCRKTDEDFIHHSPIAFLEAFIDPNPPSYLGRYCFGLLLCFQGVRHDRHRLRIMSQNLAGCPSQNQLFLNCQSL